MQQSAGAVFDMWQKLAFTFVLVASFILLYQNKQFSNAVSNLRFYGKMSLTNYITQSIIGAVIYFPFGLYLVPLLRTYGKPADQHLHVPATGMVLQVVAVPAQVDLDRYKQNTCSFATLILHYLLAFYKS